MGVKLSRPKGFRKADDSGVRGIVDIVRHAGDRIPRMLVTVLFLDLARRDADRVRDHEDEVARLPLERRGDLLQKRQAGHFEKGGAVRLSRIDGSPHGWGGHPKHRALQFRRDASSEREFKRMLLS